jgi:hypothetical protein
MITGDLYLGNNPILIDLLGLRNLKTIRGVSYPLTICNNGAISCVRTPACSTLASLSACLPTYTGSILLTDANFGSMAILLYGFYKIQGNVEISNTLINDGQLLSVFKNVQQITGYLDVKNNSNFINFEGLRSITGVNGYVLIRSNANLVSVEGLRSLVGIGGNLGINYNYNLQNVEGLRSLNNINGSMDLSYSTLVTVEGLRNLQYIRGTMFDGANYYSMGFAVNNNLARGLPFPALICIAKPVYPYVNNDYVNANIPALNGITRC